MPSMVCAAGNACGQAIPPLQLGNLCRSDLKLSGKHLSKAQNPINIAKAPVGHACQTTSIILAVDRVPHCDDGRVKDLVHLARAAPCAGPPACMPAPAWEFDAGKGIPLLVPVVDDHCLRTRTCGLAFCWLAERRGCCCTHWPAMPAPRVQPPLWGVLAPPAT